MSEALDEIVAFSFYHSHASQTARLQSPVYRPRKQGPQAIARVQAMQIPERKRVCPSRETKHTKERAQAPTARFSQMMGKKRAAKR